MHFWFLRWNQVPHEYASKNQLAFGQFLSYRDVSHSFGKEIEFPFQIWLTNLCSPKTELTGADFLRRAFAKEGHQNPLRHSKSCLERDINRVEQNPNNKKLSHIYTPEWHEKLPSGGTQLGCKKSEIITYAMLTRLKKWSTSCQFSSYEKILLF